MNTKQRLNEALDDYFDLSATLNTDLNALLSQSLNSAPSRRNFVRVTMALLEGYGHSFRRICAVGLESELQELSRKEILILRKDRSFAVNERLKHTLLAAYKLFDLDMEPSFEGKQWFQALRLMKKRDQIVNAKLLIDLDVPEEKWQQLYDGTLWLIGLFTNFVTALEAKYPERQA
ncbi:MAG: hypothetical protein AAF098_02300 [Pseudomonadota bacterium]